MEHREARESTPVFFGRSQAGVLPQFEERGFAVVEAFAAEPFKSKAHQAHFKIWEIVKGLYRQHCKQVARFKPSRRPRTKREKKPTWAERINCKRLAIATVIRSQPHINLKDVCKSTGCCYGTAKKVQQDLMFSDSVTPFEYPNQKSDSQLSMLEESVQHLQGTFKTINDLRREHPSFSRKFVHRRLRLAGYRYKLLPRDRKNKPEQQDRSKQIVEVISHLAQAHAALNTTVIFIDEAHFPLFQTASRRWTLGLQANDCVYNRRTPDEVKLSVVAACDNTGFVAIQVFKRDISSNDFLHLLQSVISRYPAKTKLTVLADQASWHTSSKVMDTAAGKFIHLNVPGLFRTNSIENSFSFVRSEFRKRPHVHSLEEEAALLVEIFFSPENRRRFEGIYKNHLRQLLLLLKANSPVLKDINDSVISEL